MSAEWIITLVSILWNTADQAMPKKKGKMAHYLAIYCYVPGGKLLKEFPIPHNPRQCLQVQIHMTHYIRNRGPHWDTPFTWASTTDTLSDANFWASSHVSIAYLNNRDGRQYFFSMSSKQIFNFFSRQVVWPREYEKEQDREEKKNLQSCARGRGRGKPPHYNGPCYNLLETISRSLMPADERGMYQSL